jgi:APA family basic amino acid/polyamine antiporter
MSTNAQQAVRRLGAVTATLLVVANMVGTGVFTTTGFLVRDIGSAPAVLIVWLVGGILALCGALAYGELVAAIPRSGGEYQLLSRIYHPAIGFTAGWISLIVGFSAPMAASSLAFGSYLSAIFPGLPPTIAAVILLVLLSLLHGQHVILGGRVQNVFTIINVLLILVLIGGGLIMGEPERAFASGEQPLLPAIVSPAFAIGLIFVAFAYCGWNGAAYIAGEVKNPAKSLPLALFFGTLIVIVLYLGLNLAFLSAAPPSELSGVVEVGHVAAVHLFGSGAGKLLSAIIALALISSVSAMIMAGPRVYLTMGEDYAVLSPLSYRTKTGGPAIAVLIQTAVALVMVITATFEALLTFIGFTLSLSAGLTVWGVVILRRKEPHLSRPYRVWGHPLTTILFVILSLWMVIHALVQRPVIALAGVATICCGVGLYFVVRRYNHQ